MTEQKTPFEVHCKDCGHEWAAFYLPLTLDEDGMRQMKEAGTCKCGSNSYLGRTVHRFADGSEPVGPRENVRGAA